MQSITGDGYSSEPTLRIRDRTNDETFVGAKFYDLDRNSARDAGDPPVRGFRVTDGQVIISGGATNLDVPSSAVTTR